MRKALAKAIRHVRRRRGFTQEALGPVSGRTYISALERGVKTPTLQKLDEIASALGVHPVSIVVLAYVAEWQDEDVHRLLDLVQAEVLELTRGQGGPTSLGEE